MRRTAAVVATVLAVATLSLTAACSTSGPSDSVASSNGGASSARTVVAITITGGKVSPIGEQVDVSVGQTVVLDITADTAGEIHVHSTPEQQVAYGVGHTQASLGAFSFPTQIEVESHTLDKTILTLQVH